MTDEPDRAWARDAVRRAGEAEHHDDRLTVRRPTTLELNQLAPLIDEQVVAAMGWDPDQARRERERLRSTMARPQLGGFVVVDRATEKVIGASELSDPHAEDRSVELGLWIAAPARGQGLAAPALELTAANAWAGGFEVVRMCVALDNHRIHGALTEIGAERAGPTARLMPDGSTVESEWFVLRRSPASSGTTAS